MPSSSRRSLTVPSRWDHDRPAGPPVGSLLLRAQAVRQLDRHTVLPTTYRSGALYGIRHLAEVRVVQAGPAGHIHVCDTDPERPFQLDGSYLIGWAHALSETLNLSVEWVGTWLACPGGHVPGPALRARLSGQAYRERLLDEHSPLLFTGSSRQGAVWQACGVAVGGRIQELPVTVEAPEE